MREKGALWFLAIVYLVYGDTKPKPKSVEPRIITADGNLIFQSASDRNISFQSDADILFDDVSIFQLLENVNNLTKRIEELETQSNPCLKNTFVSICGQNGVCIPNAQQTAGYSCICQSGWTGGKCEKKVEVSPCDKYYCQNGGKCIESPKSSPSILCECTKDWFGMYCNLPKPTSCRYEIHESFGSIQSPGYPFPYPSDIDCTWNIRAKPENAHEAFRILFTNTNIGGTCDTDYVEITDNGTGSLLDKICGTFILKTLSSVTSEISIRFHSSKNSGKTGFLMNFQTVPVKCGGKVASAFGVLKSPMYPERSYDSSHCQWLINSPTLDNFRLKFNVLEVFNKPQRCDNFIEIRSAPYSNSTVIEKICQTKRFLQVPGQTLFIQSVSYGTQDNYFSATYDVECGGRFSLDADSKMQLKSPLYPFAYQKKKHCSWHLQSPVKTALTIRVNELDTAENTSCAIDYLRVYSGKRELIGSYCGGALLYPVSSPSNEIIVDFKSGDSGEFDLFKALITVKNADCGAALYGNNGRISSPTQTNDVHCLYTITSDKENHAIEIAFDDFLVTDDEHCSKAYVQIYDGVSVFHSLLYNNSKTQGRFCGKNNPPLTLSSGRSLTVQFFSEGTNIFSAKWKAVKQVCYHHLTDPSGIFFSPAFPNNYPNGLQCTYHIESKEGHLISLMFDEFNLDHRLGTDAGDYIIIYDGDNVTSPYLGKFWGSYNAGEIVSTGNNLFIVFVSDGSDNARGFKASYKTGTNLCGGTIFGSEGFILSPSYPSPYFSNAFCVWTIVAKPGNNVRLKVETFDLGLTHDCFSEDFLQVYDGIKENGTLLQTLCGPYADTTKFKSYRERMTLIFQSNAKKEAKGFKISFTSWCGGDIDNRNGVIISPNYGSDYPSNKLCRWFFNGYPDDKIEIASLGMNLEDSPQCSKDYLEIFDRTNKSALKTCGTRNFNTSLEQKAMVVFRSDESVQDKGFHAMYSFQGCSNDFDSNRGTFQTPNYPNNFPPNSHCVWHIHVKVGYKVRLMINQYMLDAHCEKNNFTLYDGPDTNAPVIGVYCSTNHFLNKESSANEMTIVFKSDSTVSKKGFTAMYDAIEAACGGRLFAPQGLIMSPKHPNLVPKNVICKWSIALPSFQSNVEFKFEHLDLLDSTGIPTCRSNYIEIEMPGFNSTRYCGKQVPPAILTSVPFVEVTLRTDDSVHGTGFQARYKTGCGGTIQLPAFRDSIASPHFPSHYQQGKCVWVVKAPANKKITLTFTSMDLENCSNCQCDYVEVRNGDSSSNPLVGRYCGSSTPQSITSTSDALYVEFYADSVSHHTGFHAGISLDDNACGGRISGSNGYLSSPLYPMPSPVTNCVWHISVSPGSLVTLNLLELNVIQSDNCEQASLNIYEGVSQEQLISMQCELTGFNVPITSKTNTVTVVWSTTSLQNNTFRLAYETQCTFVQLDDRDGNIASPNFPRFYDNEARCSWIIRAPEGHVVQVTFNSFDLEPKTSAEECVDLVAAFDGASSSKEIGLWCGTVLPETVVSQSNTMIIIFHSDQTHVSSGFMLYYKTVEAPDCTTGLYAGKEPKYFTSSQYPHYYPNHLECVWDIKSESGSSVQLEFVDFDLEDATEDGLCSYDFVKVSEFIDNQFRTSATLCGVTGLGRNFMSETNKIRVEFVSDFAGNGRGFNVTYREICGNLRTDTVGAFGFSGGYPKNSNCTWLIQYSPGANVLVNLTDLVLESSNNCTKDYLLLMDGAQADSPVIAKLCGRSGNNTYSSSGNAMRVQFVSDSVNNIGGFKLHYRRHIIGCGGKFSMETVGSTDVIRAPQPWFPNSECEWQLEVPVNHVIEYSFTKFYMNSSCFDEYVQIQSIKGKTFCSIRTPALHQLFMSDSEVLRILFRSDATVYNSSMPKPEWEITWKIGCGGHFYSDTGRISNPALPFGTGAIQNCSFIIELPSLKQIHLMFDTLNLIGDCSSVSLKIYDLVENNLIGEYCGNDSQLPNIRAPSSKLFVNFFNNNTQSTFNATYVPAGSACGGTIGRGVFVLASLFYPHVYPINRICVWDIEYDITEQIEFNITKFDLEESTNCTKDYLEITDGFNVTRLCGKRDPFVFVTKRHNVKVVFRSDSDNIRGTGFGIIGRPFSGPKCGASLTGTSGNITSPGYPEDYGNNLECVWTMKAAIEGETVQLVITDLEIEEAVNCLYDKLAIYDGDSLVFETCSSEDISFRYISQSATLRVVFTSDSAINERGFRMEWKTVPKPDCGFVVRTNEGSITSPNYPSPYSVVPRCTWLFRPPEGHIVTLNITYLSLPGNCSAAAILIRNGDSLTSPVLARLCGNLTDLNGTVLRSTENKMRIDFVASVNGSYGDYKGFNITYFTNHAGCGDVIRAENGTITSLDYPRPYSKTYDCVWLIETPPGTVVFLYMDSLAMIASSDCVFDVLEIRDGDSAESPLLTQLCGSTHTSVIQSTGNRVYVRQRLVRYYGSANGFKLHFNTGCGGVLKGKTGYALTPNYPGQYPVNQNCVWRIEVPFDYRVHLTETNFHLPNPNNIGVCSDKVNVFEGGMVNDSRKLLELCGRLDGLGPLDSGLNKLLVQFISDNITESGYTGAKAHYEAKCGQHIKSSAEGFIKFPSSGVYPHDEECVWIIEYPEGRQITVFLSVLELEGGDHCPYDYLEMRDGNTATAPLIGRFCGGVMPPVLQTTGNSLYVKFKSDVTVSRSGFLFHYNNDTLSCGGVFKNDSGEFSSPSTKARRGAEVRCGYKLLTEPGKKLNVTFYKVSLNEDDFDCENSVTIYDYEYPVEEFKREKKLCYSTTPVSFISTGHAMYFAFEAETSPAMFTAQYETIKTECGGHLSVTSDSGTIESPDSMKPGTECLWVLIGKEGQQIAVELFADYQNENDSCSKNYVVFQDGFNMLERFHRFCSTKKAISLHSGGHLASILLHKDDTSSGQFRLTYTLLEDCSFVYTADSGLITSPNYPRNYSHNANCSYHVKADAGKRITFFTYVIMIEISPVGDCRFDNLTIFPNTTKHGEIIKKENVTLCGLLRYSFGNQSWSVRSNSNEASLQFVSDRYLYGTGFAITYSVSDQECGGPISGHEGVFTSPHFPKIYGKQYSCVWTITVEPGKKIMLNVTDMETEPPQPGADCSTVDYIELIDGVEGSGGESWAKFCGHAMHPAPRISTSNRLQVKFTSNSVKNNYRGFRVFFKEIS